MKKIFLIFLFAVFIIGQVGCNNNNSNEFNDWNYLENYDQPNSTSITWLLPTQDRYYYLTGSGLMYFSEKENMYWFPLCGHAQCPHEDSNCSAFLGTTFLLGQYGEQLIYGTYPSVEDEYSVYRIYSMAMDGSEKKVLKEFSAADDISLSGGVHRGCAYYKIYHYLTNDLEIYRLDITEPDGEQELIYEGTGDAILNGIGTVMNMLVLDADGTFLYQYDITARTVTQLETDAFFNVRAVRFCRDGSIMYAVGNEMHRLDPNSMEDSIIGRMDGETFFADDELLYVHGKNETDGYAVSFDKTASETDRIPFPCPEEKMKLSTDSDYILLINTSTELPKWYMKKSELLAGQGQWYPIETG